MADVFFFFHLTDGTCHDYSVLPPLPQGLTILGDRAFPQHDPFLVLLRRGQGVEPGGKADVNR